VSEPIIIKVERVPSDDAYDAMVKAVTITPEIAKQIVNLANQAAEPPADHSWVWRKPVVVDNADRAQVLGSMAAQGGTGTNPTAPVMIGEGIAKSLNQHGTPTPPPDGSKAPRCLDCGTPLMEFPTHEVASLHACPQGHRYYVDGPDGATELVPARHGTPIPPPGGDRRFNDVMRTNEYHAMSAAVDAIAEIIAVDRGVVSNAHAVAVAIKRGDIPGVAWSLNNEAEIAKWRGRSERLAVTLSKAVAERDDSPRALGHSRARAALLACILRDYPRGQDDGSWCRAKDLALSDSSVVLAAP
jgi:hypothetical protein